MAEICLEKEQQRTLFGGLFEWRQIELVASRPDRIELSQRGKRGANVSLFCGSFSASLLLPLETALNTAHCTLSLAMQIGQSRSKAKRRDKEICFFPFSGFRRTLFLSETQSQFVSFLWCCSAKWPEERKQSNYLFA